VQPRHAYRVLSNSSLIAIQTDSNSSQQDATYQVEDIARSDVTSTLMDVVQILGADDFNMMNWGAKRPEQTKPEQIIQENSSLEWPSLFDYSTFTYPEIEALDPHLPTLKMDLEFFGLDESWPCLNRIPTPPLVDTEESVQRIDVEKIQGIGHEAFPSTSSKSCSSAITSLSGSPNMGFDPMLDDIYSETTGTVTKNRLLC